MRTTKLCAVLLASGDELLLEGEGDRCLSSSAESCEPNSAASEPAAHDLCAPEAGHIVLLRVDVGGHHGALKERDLDLLVVTLHY
jgi:hypothetical protein